MRGSKEAEEGSGHEDDHRTDAESGRGQQGSRSATANPCGVGHENGRAGQRRDRMRLHAEARLRA
jgi:hypothetical protein